jgi:hypothetical protein
VFEIVALFLGFEVEDDDNPAHIVHDFIIAGELHKILNISASDPKYPFR